MPGVFICIEVLVVAHRPTAGLQPRMSSASDEAAGSPLISRLEASHQAGIHTAVETCLHVPWKYIEPALPFIDLFLADLKHVDEAVFQQWTDGSARRVLDNLQRLAQAGKKMIIRVPLIQGFNASEADIAAITDFAADRLQVSEIHYLPYHTLGMNKYQLLSQPYTAPDKPLDAPELLAFAQDYARSKGLTAILRG